MYVCTNIVVKSHTTQNEQIVNENEDRISLYWKRLFLLKHLQKETTQAITLTNTGRESKTETDRPN